MVLHIQKDPAAVSHELAEWITAYIASVLSKKDRFTWVLTGGSSPKTLYDLLASPTYSSRIAWEKLHFFWGDERAVPFDDDRNNAKMTYEHLLNKVPVTASQVHVMRTDIDPDKAAAEYEQVLRTCFTGEGQSFDLVLTGMGDDGIRFLFFPAQQWCMKRKPGSAHFTLPRSKCFALRSQLP